MRYPYSTNDGWYKRPVVKVFLYGSNSKWIPLDMVLDSGADISVVPIQVVHELRLQSPQVPIIVGQVAGSVPSVYTSAKASIANKVFNMPIIGVRWFDMPLLGRAGLLDNFDVSFGQSEFSITPR